MLNRNLSDTPALAQAYHAMLGTLVFEGLSDDEKEEFLSKGRIKHYQRGEHLFKQGDDVKHFYILQSGIVRLFRATPTGEEITTDILTAGSPICERKVLKYNSVHPDYALAVEDSTAMEFPAAWLRDYVRKNPTFSLNMLMLLSQRALLKDIEAEHQVTMSASQVVACFLQRLCSTHGFDPAGFELPYSKSLIASRLGMKQETFSRTLPKLKENGIDLQGTHVRIQNLADLDKYTCAHCSFMDDCPARIKSKGAGGEDSPGKTLAA